MGEQDAGTPRPRRGIVDPADEVDGTDSFPLRPRRGIFLGEDDVVDPQPAEESTTRAAGEADGGATSDRASEQTGPAGSGTTDGPAAGSHESDGAASVPGAAEPDADPTSEVRDGETSPVHEAPSESAAATAADWATSTEAQPGVESADVERPTFISSDVSAELAAELSAPTAGASPASTGAEAHQWHEPVEHHWSRRTRLSLLIAAAAGVLVIALAVGFAVWSHGRGEVAVTPSASASATPVDPLPVGSMLSDKDAAKIVKDAGWKVSLDQEAVTADSPQPTCLVTDQDGLPTPERTRLRTLTSAEDTQLAALQRADLYTTPEDAEKSFDTWRGQLADCTKQPAYLRGTYAPKGLGDEASGVVVVIQDEKDTYHSLLVVRTGRLVSTFDVAQLKSAPPFEAMTGAVAGVVNRQCTKVAGICADDVSQNPTLPLLGSEPAGFLTSVDLPRITPGQGEWSGTEASTEFPNLSTSQCEGMNPFTVGAEARKQRTMLLNNDSAAPTTFGMDEVLLTTKDAKAADKIRTDYDKSMKACPKKLLTAKVSDAEKIEGKVAGKTVAGTSYKVRQTVADSDPVLYRVSLATVDSTVVYLILPYDEKFDFSDQQWAEISLRATERATQNK